MRDCECVGESLGRVITLDSLVNVRYITRECFFSVLCSLIFYNIDKGEGKLGDDYLACYGQRRTMVVWYGGSNMVN